MRKGADFDFGGEDDDLDALEAKQEAAGIFTFDWKEHADSIMYRVNTELKQHGLEVIEHETNSDFYAFSIIKLGAPI